MLERKYLNLKTQADLNYKAVIAQCSNYEEKIKAVKVRNDANTLRLETFETDMEACRYEIQHTHTSVSNLVNSTKSIYEKANTSTNQKLQEYSGNLSNCQKKIKEFEAVINNYATELKRRDSQIALIE